MKRARASNPDNFLYLNPDDIRFSQDTIAATFTNGKAIGKTLDALVRMEVFVPEIPPITVAMQNGVFFTRNNRRLWVYKQLAAMNRCSFIPCKRAHFVPREQLTTAIGGHEIIIRGDHQSETLAEFNVQKRKEMLKKIRSRQITDDVPRGTFRPRFEFMTDQKRRKVKAKRRIVPKPEVQKDAKIETSSKHTPVSINTTQDDEVEPVAKARKLEANVACQDKPLELNEVPSSKREPLSNKECDTNTNVKDATEHAVEALDGAGDKIDSKGDRGDKYDFEKHANKKPDTNFASDKEVNSGEPNKDWVVIDQIGDCHRDDSCTIDIKMTDKQPDTNLFTFTAENKPSTIPKKSVANRAKAKFSKPKTRMSRGKTRYPLNRRANRPYVSPRGLSRGGNRFNNHEVSKSPYGEHIPFSSNDFVQPQRSHLLPIPYVENTVPQYQHDTHAHEGHYPSYMGHGAYDYHVPAEQGMLIAPVMYPQQNEYLTGSYNDHILQYHRY